MSKEATVGAFTLGGLLLFAVAVIKLSGVSFFDRGYLLYAGFNHVTGLSTEAPVMLSGVPVGKVVKIENEGSGVTVTMRIQDDVKIAKDSIVTIASNGVMGEKFISVKQGKDIDRNFEAEDYILAVDEMGMDSMLENINKTVLQVQELLTAVNSILADPNLKGSLVDTAVNIRDTTAHLSALMEGMNQTVRGNKHNVNIIMQNLAGTMESLNATMKNVEHITANADSVLGSPETAKNIAATLTNIKVTSERVEKIAKGVEDIVTDPKTKEDLKATISNARAMTEKADKMLGKVGSVEVTPSVDVMYAGKERDWRTNFNANIAVSDTFFDLGVEGIGEDNKVNAAIGKKLGFVTPRAGVLHGKIGAGLGFGNEKFKVTADAYDFNKMRVRLRSEAEIMDDTFFVAEIHNLNKRSERKTYFGLKRNF